MTVVKDFYKAETKLVIPPINSFLQIYFNQQVDFFNAFFLGANYKNQSVIGYDGSDTGVLGIATANASGWLGGDSNALVELSNGNFLMGFGDSFYGQLQNDGLYSGSTQTEDLGVHNSFSYLITSQDAQSILVNQFFIGANQNKVRSSNDPSDTFKNDANIINSKVIIKSLCTSIVLGELYNIDWAPQGRSSILTPDLSNQINYELLQRTATSGNCWPVAGMVQTSSDAIDTLYWILFNRFKLNNVEFSQTQILRIKHVAEKQSKKLLISPYDWDSNSTIASLPFFMNQPILIPNQDIYTCSVEWTRAFQFGKYNYLMGAGFSSATSVFLTRSTKPCFFYKGTGIQAWTADGWVTNTSPTETIDLQPLIFQLSDGSNPFTEKDNLNQLSEIYEFQNTYNILFLSSTVRLGSLTTKYQVYRFRSPKITGPYIRDELPIFDDFDPFFDNFTLYEMRVYPALNKFVPSVRDNKPLQAVFSIVAQPYYTHGNDWYGLQSFFQVYKPQFYFYYDDS